MSPFSLILPGPRNVPPSTVPVVLGHTLPFHLKVSPSFWPHRSHLSFKFMLTCVTWLEQS